MLYAKVVFWLANATTTSSMVFTLLPIEFQVAASTIGLDSLFRLLPWVVEAEGGELEAASGVTTRGVAAPMSGAGAKNKDLGSWGRRLSAILAGGSWASMGAHSYC